MYMYVNIYIYVCEYIYIYVYIERERAHQKRVAEELKLGVLVFEVNEHEALLFCQHMRPRLPRSVHFLKKNYSFVV
jgi:hypothetical protein